MGTLSNEELIQKAVSLINIKVINQDRKIGDVACVLITDQGNIFTGVNIAGHVGICAEQTAAGAMVTAREYRIAKIVVAREENGKRYVIPPCGRCRDFLVKVDRDNLEAEFILDRETVVKVKDLLPHYKDYRDI